MATETGTAPAAEPRAETGSGVVPYRLTVRQYLKMIEADIFPEGAHVELLGGVLIDKMTKYPLHNVVIGLLAEALRRLFPNGWTLREEKSVELGRFWRPEPDLAVVVGKQADYFTRDPRAVDIGLLVEVADSSYRADRGPKWRRYAATRVQIYWIVDLSNRQIEVHTDPAGRGRSARYQALATFTAADSVPVVLDGRELGRIAVPDLFPAPPAAAGPSPGAPAAPVP